jgi:hypothetical protein
MVAFSCAPGASDADEVAEAVDEQRRELALAGRRRGRG